MLTCFRDAPPRDHALGAAAERLTGQTGRPHKASLLCTVWPVCDLKLEQGCAGKHRGKKMKNVNNRQTIGRKSMDELYGVQSYI